MLLKHCKKFCLKFLKKLYFRGICTKDIYPCIIMEYCEKGGLFDVIRKTQITKEGFCRWSKEIADGMNYLHSLKILHRDLKTPKYIY